jgi:hypothetical protein
MKRLDEKAETRRQPITIRTQGEWYVKSTSSGAARPEPSCKAASRRNMPNCSSEKQRYEYRVTMFDASKNRSVVPAPHRSGSRCHASWSPAASNKVQQANQRRRLLGRGLGSIAQTGSAYCTLLSEERKECCVFAFGIPVSVEMRRKAANLGCCNAGA